MKLSKATFSINGCFIDIDGIPMNIASKVELLRQGFCWVSAMSAEHEQSADDLRISPCGQDGNVFACAEPQLVELALRYYAWLNTGISWLDVEQEALLPVAAAIVIQQHLSTFHP
jgi:hypothetical protein